MIDRTLGCLFLPSPSGSCSKYLTDRTVGFLPFGRFLYREVVGYIRVGHHFVDIAPDEVGTIIFSDLSPPPVIDQNADQQQD